VVVGGAVVGGAVVGGAVVGGVVVVAGPQETSTSAVTMRPVTINHTAFLFIPYPSFYLRDCFNFTSSVNPDLALASSFPKNKKRPFHGSISPLVSPHQGDHIHEAVQSPPFCRSTLVSDYVLPRLLVAWTIWDFFNWILL
jgi:hypothetical protein